MHGVINTVTCADFRLCTEADKGQWFHLIHYNDTMMSAMASQITSVFIVYPTLCLGADQRKKSKPRVTGLFAGSSQVTDEFATQRPVTRKMFPFDDVIMMYSISAVLSISRCNFYSNSWQRTPMAPRCGVHYDVIKWKHFPHYWPFVREIHRWPVNSPHNGQWRGALRASLICAWINVWVNNRDAGDLRRHRAHYDVIAMSMVIVQPDLYHGHCRRIKGSWYILRP